MIATPGRTVVRLLATEFAVRLVVGVWGLLYPHQGDVVQRVLIVWGLVAFALVLHAATRHRGPWTHLALAAVWLVGLVLLMRVIIDQTHLTDTLLVSVRLLLPIVAAPFFVLNGESAIELSVTAIRTPPVRRILSIATVFLLSFLVGLRVHGQPWSWSPQQPVPYLLLVPMGAAHTLTAVGVSVTAMVTALSLKRSALAALGLLLLIAPSSGFRRRLLPTALVAVTSLTVMTFLAGRDLLMRAWSVVTVRTMSGIEQMQIALTDPQAPALSTSLGTRVVENSTAFEAWANSVGSLLFGVPLQELEAGGRSFTTVHNTFLAMLTLGGLFYMLAFLVTLSFSVAKLRSPSRPRYQDKGAAYGLTAHQGRWLLAGGAAGLAEAFFGNGMLTVTFPASIAAVVIAIHQMTLTTGSGVSRSEGAYS